MEWQHAGGPDWGKKSHLIGGTKVGASSDPIDQRPIQSSRAYPIVDGLFCGSHVLLADPEERRIFMDMRVLLVRGDMGEAESLPSRAAPTSGLSPRRLSRHEP